MARTKRVRRHYSASEWGRNRVRIFPDPKTGPIQIEGGARTDAGLFRSLQHGDRTWAKKQTDEFGAGFANPELRGDIAARRRLAHPGDAV